MYKAIHTIVRTYMNNIHIYIHFPVSLKGTAGSVGGWVIHQDVHKFMYICT
jgi:hypothetical protein